MWDQVLQENLRFYHSCFLVFLPHKLCVHYTTVSWMLLSLPSTYWAHRVNPGSRWSEGRLGYSRALVLDSHLNNLAAGVILGPLGAWRRVQLQIEWHWAICAVNGNDHIWSRSLTISRLLIQEMPRGWRATNAMGMEFCWCERKRGVVSSNRVMFGSHTNYLWMQMVEKKNELTHSVKYYIKIIANVVLRIRKTVKRLRKKTTICKTCLVISGVFHTNCYLLQICQPSIMTRLNLTNQTIAMINSDTVVGTQLKYSYLMSLEWECVNYVQFNFLKLKF